MTKNFSCAKSLFVTSLSLNRLGTLLLDETATRHCLGGLGCFLLYQRSLGRWRLVDLGRCDSLGVFVDQHAVVEHDLLSNALVNTSLLRDAHIVRFDDSLTILNLNELGKRRLINVGLWNC